MIEEITEKRMVEQEVSISEICKCDVCKKKIYEKRLSEPGFSTYGNRVEWFDITTGHCDWGNDSVDSIKEWHACSPECVNSFMKDYYDHSYGKCGCNTHYINIEHRYGSTIKGDN